MLGFWSAVVTGPTEPSHQVPSPFSKEPLKHITNAVLLTALVHLLAQSPLRANTIFASISGDPNNSFVPDQLSSVDQAQQTVTGVATLGDGSLGFNGGLTYGTGGNLYAIANDFTGAGSFYSIQPNGTLNLIGSAGGLGNGFLGGLAYDPFNGTFYAAVLDDQDNTTLESIDSSGTATALGQSLGTDFTGLTFDLQNGLFYGIGNDDTGFSTLYSFSLGGSPTAVAALGFGFGALTYDYPNNVLWAIDPVNNFSSQLYQITPSGTVSGPLFTLGDGFVELAAASVPEPASAAEVLAGLLGGVWFFRRRTKNPNSTAHKP